MSINWSYEDENLLVIRVSGVLTKSELDVCQSEVEPMIKKGNAKLLVIVEDFDGWSKSDEWGDVSFSERNDPYIYKMAILDDDKWRELAAMFTMQGLRDVPIEYFLTDQEIPARQWLSE